MASLNTPYKVLCIYCCKSPTRNIESSNSIEIHKQFLNFISRHLNLNGKFIELLGECVPKPCNDCLGVITSFCELYHQLKCLELQLNWQVDKLCNVMRWADRVPSRIKEFRNIDDFERKFEFRKIFKEKCELYFAQQPPRVVLPIPYSNKLSQPEIPVCIRLMKGQQNTRSEVRFAKISTKYTFNTHSHPYNDEDIEQEGEHELEPIDEELETLPQIVLESLLAGESENRSDGTNNNFDYHESQNYSCNVSTNDNDYDDEASIGISDDSIQIQEEIKENSSVVKEMENTQLSNVETIVTSHYETFPTTNVKHTCFKIESESHLKELIIPPEESHNAPNTLSAPPSFPSRNRILPEINEEKSCISTRRSLRTKFQCSNCKRTFSDEKRFKVHSSLCNQSIDTDSETSDTEEENEKDVKIKTEFDNRITDGTMSDLESSLSCTNSSPGEDFDDIGKEKRIQCNIRQKYLCSKCTPPTEVDNSMLHELYKHSNGHSRLNAVNVQRLNLTLNSLKLEVISLETEYQCTADPDKCSRKFPISGELENHAKLHTKFTCVICDIGIDYALNLIDHELEHSDVKKLSENNNFKKGEISHCVRCDYKTFLKQDFVNHYLKEHLELPEIQVKCPICQQRFQNYDTVPLTHYINNHDLNRLDNVGEKVKCTELDCHAYFLTEDQLHVHWNREHGYPDNEAAIIKKAARLKQNLRDKNILCPYCPKKVSASNLLQKHILGQHLKESGFQDAEVTKGERVITRDGLAVDDIVLEKNAKYFCKVNSCKEKFRNEEDFQSHLKLHGEFPCKFCETVSTFATDLAVHETVHVENLNEIKKGRRSLRNMKFRCSRCPYLSGRKDKYVDHFVWQHLGLEVDKKKCPICKHPFTIYFSVSTSMNHEFRRRIYQHYIEWHDFTGVEGGEETALKCDKCTAYFRTNLQLMQHTDEVHNSRCQSNTCEDCGHNFANNASLRNHRSRVHKVHLKFACSVPECDKKFEKNKDLIYHQNSVHHGNTTTEKRFGCEECGKKFFAKISLLSHLKAHKKTKHGSVCEQCGKSFKDKFSLELHCKFHDGPESWDFTCEICGKKIYSQQKLTEHMRVHTKEKPFVCQVCGVAYGHRHNLRIHVNSKHKEIQDVARKRAASNFASSRKGKRFK